MACLAESREHKTPPNAGAAAMAHSKRDFVEILATESLVRASADTPPASLGDRALLPRLLGRRA